MTISFARHQVPPAIIRHAVWLYVRFTLSYRDVEDLLAERGLDVSYETVRRWVLKFGRRCHAFWTCDRSSGSIAKAMRKISYAGSRLPPEIIQQAIWLYLRFNLSFRDVGDLLAEREIMVSYETVRR